MWPHGRTAEKNCALLLSPPQPHSKAIYFENEYTLPSRINIDVYTLSTIVFIEQVAVHRQKRSIITSNAKKNHPHNHIKPPSTALETAL